MPPPARFRLFSLSRGRLALAAAAFVAVVVGISWLGLDVLRQIEQESESRSDNAQWALSQIEVELLYLLIAADSAHHGAVPLDNVRLRYDIFYSRLETLKIGRVFGGLRDTQKYIDCMARLSAFMDRYLPYIDGPDDALRGRLPALFSDARAMIGDARVVALTGVKVIAAVSDQRRAEVAKTLILAGGLTILLVAFLAALVIMLLRLFRFNRMRSAENLATLSRLDAVVSTALEALVTVDDRGRIVDFNEAACQTFGYAKDEAVGADMATLLAADTPDTRPLFRHGAAPDIAGQGRFRIMTRHKDGRTIPTEVSISHVTAGDQVLYVAFLRDLSAQLAAERALVAARDEALAGEKAKADLLVVMSHEIRTPLNGMIGTIDLLESTDLQPHQREYLRIMEASGKLLMHHVNDVLDIARLDSGKAPFLSGPVDLGDLAREVIENQMPASQANGNVMTYVPPADGRTRVECDGAQLRHVLLNLIGNAVKFTRNGQITVEIAHKGPEGPTEISVRDTGIGIPPADLDRIFDDFVTLDATYARRSSGTGLGLGIARRIVAQMGGTLSVDSQTNRGSTFRINLPLKFLSAPQHSPAPTPARPAARRLTALVVEDNEINRLIVREMLTKEGHEVVEARDGFEGIALAAARRFDLILMDISMPRVDGLQAANSIRTGQGASRRSPIVAMTAHALAGETARFRAGGMVDVLLKPITRDGLRAVLRTVLSDAPAPPIPLLDPAVLTELARDLGADRAGSLLGKFRDETAQLTARITTPPPDPALLRDIHRLQGSAAIFGAQRLQAALSALETAWKSGMADQSADLLADLAAIWQATDTALSDITLAPQDADNLAHPSNLR